MMDVPFLYFSSVGARQRTFCHAEEIASVKSAQSDAGHSEHSPDRDCPLLVGRKEAEIFDVFSDEFAGGDWAFPSLTDLQMASPYADEDHSDCETGHSKLFSSDALMSSVVTGVDLPSQTPTADSKILRKSPTASPEERGNSSPDSNRDKTDADASITPDFSIVDAILAHSSIRVLSNTTYLRRMHLSRDDAVALFPEIRTTMEAVFSTCVKRHASQGLFKAGIDVSLQDGQGRRWPVVLQVVRTAGQRHVRLNKGWSQICIANGFAVGKCVRLARWDQDSSPKEALVTVSTV